jgi:ClpP class serine protease
MELINLVYLLFIALFLFPQIKQTVFKRLRLIQIKKLQKKRKSRVITLVHRRILPGILGMLTGGFISVEDSEEILRAIRSTPDDKPIDLIVHTPGGLVLATEQVAEAISKHPAKVTLIVPHYAMSGGTLLGLAADEIIMDKNAILGRVDPQIFGMPAVSIRQAVAQKSKDEVEDRMLIFDDVSKKALVQNKKSIKKLLKVNKYTDKEIKKIIDNLASGKYTHDHPITFEEAQKLGLKVKAAIPEEVYRFIQLFPQQGRQQPVQYLPSKKNITESQVKDWPI